MCVAGGTAAGGAARGAGGGARDPHAGAGATAARAGGPRRQGVRHVRRYVPTDLIRSRSDMT